MDLVARRALSAAHNELLKLTEPKGNAPSLTEAQRRQVSDVAHQLEDLMTSDTSPPECPTCHKPLPSLPGMVRPPQIRLITGQGLPNGRPRQYCSDRCRQAAFQAYRRYRLYGGPAVQP
jgi:hypothetical protein